MKKNILTIFLSALFFSAFSQANNEATKALSEYKNFVDSIVNEYQIWNSINLPDTEYAEVPIDPNDPEATKIDTIITSVADKRERAVFAQDWKNGKIKWRYDVYFDHAQLVLSYMSEAQKKEWEETKKKFEALSPPK